MNNEIFKTLSICENYSVSNYGNVKNNKTGKILSPRDLKGYKRVSLWYNNKANDHRIHRLVAQEFINNEENKKEVNHINGIRNDNRVENLEWCTAEENVYHKKTVLNQGDSFKGEKNGNSVLTELNILEIRSSNKTTSELSKMYDVSYQQIDRILKNKLWTHI